MSYTEEQIIQSLPPALQGELKEFGPLEARTTQELRNFLLTKREQYHLPPWHAFTCLLQNAALATGESQKVNAQNCWYTTRSHYRKSDGAYTLDAANEPSWCYVTMHMTNSKGDTESRRFAVQPKTKRIWKMDSEYDWKQKSVVCGNPGHTVHMPVSAVLRIASKALGKGQTQIEYNYVSRPKREAGTPPKAQKRDDAPAPISAKQDTSHISTPPASNVQLLVSEVQKEVIRTILDLASVKARELGMHSTIVRWKQTLNPIIAQEVRDAEIQ